MSLYILYSTVIGQHPMNPGIQGMHRASFLSFAAKHKKAHLSRHISKIYKRNARITAKTKVKVY